MVQSKRSSPWSKLGKLPIAAKPCYAIRLYNNTIEGAILGVLSEKSFRVLKLLISLTIAAAAD